MLALEVRSLQVWQDSVQHGEKVGLHTAPNFTRQIIAALYELRLTRFPVNYLQESCLG